MALHAFIRLIFPSQKYMALHLLELPQPHSASLPNITPFQLSVANKTFLAVLPDLAVLAVLSAVVRLTRTAALGFVHRAWQPSRYSRFKEKRLLMLTPEQVKTLITAELDCTHVDVEGDGHHFFAVIVSPAFAGKRLIERHRLVMDIARAKLDSNELHALSITQALTPEEWAQKA